MDIQFKNDRQIFNCRSVGICIKQNKILLSKAKGDDYWTFLGGKPLFNETTENAVIRKYQEETGFTLQVNRLLSVTENFFEMNGSQWHEFIFFYLLEDKNDFIKVSEIGQPILDNKNAVYQWFDIDDFMNMDIRPSCAKNIVKDMPQQIIHLVNTDKAEETNSNSRRKSKKIPLAVIGSLICILLVIWLAVSFFSNHSDDNSFPFGEDEHIWELNWFGEETYSELHENCSDEDINELQPLLDDIEHAFSSIYATTEEAKKDLGKLWVFSVNRDDAAREEHQIYFITGKVSGDNAYLWIKYWQRVYDATGKEIMGSGSQKEMIKVRITAEKQDGKWVATKTMQGP